MARTRIPPVLVVLAAVFGWFLAFAPAAYAHAELEATTPTNGQHLAAAPQQVTMRFSERVNLIRNGIQVLDRSGQRRNKADPRTDGGTVVIPLDSGLTDGVYTVNWRVVSADSHPINGAFVFSVGTATAAPLTGPAESSGAAGAVAGAFWVFRWGAYTGLALLVGGVFFRVVCWPAARRDRRARRIVWGGWIASLVSAVGSLLLQGPNSAGSSLGNAFSPSLLGSTVGTDFGVAVLVRIGLLVVAGLALRWLFAAGTDDVTATRPAVASSGSAKSGRAAQAKNTKPAKATKATRAAKAGKPAAGTVSADATSAGSAEDSDRTEVAAGRIGRGQLGALTALAVLLVGTWSWTGHAHVGDQVPLAVLADVVHLSAMSVWVGGLVLLIACVLPRQRAVLSEAARALPRFSLSALVAVALLVSTGTYAAWREVRSLSALSGTEYGKLLIFKLAAFGVLMALAVMSRSTVQRRYVVPVTRAAAAQAPPRPGPAGGVSRKAQREQEEQERSALGALRQSVRLEAGIVAGVLAVTALLVATPPGQVAGAFAAAPTAGQAPSGLPFARKIPITGVAGVSVQVNLQPARTGDNTLVLKIVNDDGTLHDVRDITAEFTLPEQNLGPLPVKLERFGVAQYTTRAVTLPSPGNWHLKVGVRVSEFDQESVSVDIPVA
ncbi:MAG TPA: copper resistance protein CopC [Mycobacteriales bacterium]